MCVLRLLEYTDLSLASSRASLEFIADRDHGAFRRLIWVRKLSTSSSSLRSHERMTDNVFENIRRRNLTKWQHSSWILLTPYSFFFCNEIHHVDVEWIFRGVSLADVWLLWIFLLTQDIIYFQLGLWDLCRWSYLTGSDVVRWRRANNKNTWVTLMDGIMRMRKMRMVISWEDKMIF